MTDQEFIDGFFSGRLPNDGFHHRDHLRLTWLVLSRHGRERGGQMVADAIRHVAAAHGEAARYHETMTRFWVWLVDHVMKSGPRTDSFDAFLLAFPAALDKNLPYRHWTRERMMSSEARTAWLEPDLLPLPSTP